MTNDPPYLATASNFGYEPMYFSGTEKGNTYEEKAKSQTKILLQKSTFQISLLHCMSQLLKSHILSSALQMPFDPVNVLCHIGVDTGFISATFTGPERHNTYLVFDLVVPGSPERKIEPISFKAM